MTVTSGEGGSQMWFENVRLSMRLSTASCHVPQSFRAASKEI